MTIQQMLLGISGALGYLLQRSIRLRASASAYFSRTPSVAATSNQKMTYSAWVKRGQLGVATAGALLSSGTQLVNDDIIRFATDNLQLWFNAAASYYLITTQVFRDPSAWYHIVISIDTTQATAANRVIFYVNGAQITAFSTANYPPQNYTFGQFNQNGAGQRIGLYSSTYFDGYLAEVNVIDGQALTPTSFGEYNSITNVWQPKAYSGTYGTNGFYLNFQDNSAATAAAIGKDSSGNGNNWTPNNISVTAGVTYDSMLDIPTLTSATQANFPTLNPLQITAASIGTISSANLSWSCGSSATYGKIYGTMAFPSTGQYYWEVTAGSTANLDIGIISATDQTTFYPGYSPVGYTYYQNTGQKVNNNVYTAYGASYTTNDVIGVAFDATAGTLTFYKNNVSQGTAFTGLTGTYVAALGNEASGASTSASINFGQRPFTYTPPSGFVSLNTYNLISSAIPNGAAQFASTLYTGTGAVQSITNTVNGTSLQPDFVWIKNRNNTAGHSLFDSVRGVSASSAPFLQSQSTGAENNFNGTVGDRNLTSLNSNGFTLGADALGLTVNGSGRTYVAWQWKASNAAAVSNTSGSITSQVSANPTAGFSIVTYTGTGANATVGHGLGIAPKMIIVKLRSALQNWGVYHASIGNTGAVFLNLTNATDTNIGYWNNTSPTSTVFSIGTGGTPNTNAGTYVAYCFAEISGFSKFGSYTGTGTADGPFVYTGFRPRYVCVKRTDTTGGWTILDSSRDTYNVAGNYLFAETSAAEGSTPLEDFLSNGFKLRASSTSTNGAGTYIYMAFAENPFKNALAR